jgi:hypothetical protein
MVVSALVDFVDGIWRDRSQLVFVYNDLDYRISGNPDVDVDGIFSANLSKTDASLFAGSRPLIVSSNGLTIPDLALLEEA